MEISDDEKFFIKLRDCFAAGYTFPQYCIDNGIKNPLFVSEKKHELFCWEIHYQFFYDNRLTPQFSFIDDDKTIYDSYARDGFNASLKVKIFLR